MEVTFKGTKDEIKQQFKEWYESVDKESPTLYNRFIVTGNKKDKVKLGTYKSTIAEIAISERISLKSVDNEIMACYNVEKKRYKDGFYIRGIQLKEEK
jgi:hypothetical protein